MWWLSDRAEVAATTSGNCQQDVMQRGETPATTSGNFDCLRSLFYFVPREPGWPHSVHFDWTRIIGIYTFGRLQDPNIFSDAECWCLCLCVSKLTMEVDLQMQYTSPVSLFGNPSDTRFLAVRWQWMGDFTNAGKIWDKLFSIRRRRLLIGFFCLRDRPPWQPSNV